MIDTLNIFLPGTRDLIRGRGFKALQQFLGIGIFGLWWYAYLDAVVGSLVLLAILANSAYRELYARYWRRLSEEFFSEEGTSPEKSASELTVLAKTPWWWRPVLRWNWLFITAVIASVHALGSSTRVNLAALTDGWPVVVEFAHGLLNPDWSLISDAVFIYARQTVEVALLGTGAGFILALPVSFFAAHNLMSGSIPGRIGYFCCRTVMVVIRAIPTFLLGLIFVALVGLGPFPGVLAITVFSMGVMVKLFSEAIEAADKNVAEAVFSCGGGWVNMVVFGIWPQVVPAILAQLLYCVEINVHSATVLGLIGAEGIGLPIHEYLSALAYDRAAVFIFVTIVMTIVIDYASAYVRKKII